MKFGLIGHPIAGSMSPALFRAAYGGRWEYDLIEGISFEDSWQRFIDSYDGINVTAPFKEDAFRCVGELSPEARFIKAVNLVTKRLDADGNVITKGYNTDYYGIKLSLRETLREDFMLSGKNAMVAGCGGAGRAAAFAVADLGCRVTLVNRTYRKACGLAAELKESGFEAEAVPMEAFAEELRASDIIVYTIPTAIPCLGNLKVEDFGTDPDGKIILEANYKSPAFTSGKVADELAKSSATYISGLRWIYFQAVAGYSFFTGKSPDSSAMDLELQD